MFDGKLLGGVPFNGQLTGGDQNEMRVLLPELGAQRGQLGVGQLQRVQPARDFRVVPVAVSATRQFTRGSDDLGIDDVHLLSG